MHLMHPNYCQMFIIMYMYLVYTCTHTQTYVHAHTTVDYQVTKKSFKFARTHHLPFFFVSASDGTNVVKVHIHSYMIVQISYLLVRVYTQ